MARRTLSLTLTRTRTRPKPNPNSSPTLTLSPTLAPSPTLSQPQTVSLGLARRAERGHACDAAAERAAERCLLPERQGVGLVRAAQEPLRDRLATSSTRLYRSVVAGVRSPCYGKASVNVRAVL